jgi:berberine-like enzyme
VLNPLRTFGAPVLDLCAARPFVEHQSMLDPSYPHGLWAYLQACDVRALTDDVVEITLDHAARIESPRSTVTIWQLGGAVARVGADDTAFAGRSSGHIFNITGATDTAEGFDREKAWARDMSSALSPHHTGVYVNFLMDEGEERIRQAYGAAKYQRLRSLKRKHDPNNVFRLNQNIPPA